MRSARIGLIVILRANWVLNANPWPDGLETGNQAYSMHVNGGEVTWNPFEPRIPRYPSFWPRIGLIVI